MNKNKMLNMMIGLFTILVIGMAIFTVSLICVFYADSQVTKAKEQFEIELAQKESPIYVINEPRVELLPICDESTFKSWLDFRAITAPNSLQYKLQGYAETNSLTGIRMLDNRYLVAMTDFYGEVGDKLDIKLESGMLLEVILGDIKGVGHNYCNSNNDSSIIEFIVDSKEISDRVRISGNFNDKFKGKITEIRKVHR